MAWEKQQLMAQADAHVGDPDEAAGSWIQPGQHWALQLSGEWKSRWEIFYLCVSPPLSVIVTFKINQSILKKKKKTLSRNISSVLV